MSTSDLVQNPRNSRTHSTEQVAQISKSIREWGWTVPILIDESGQIIAGHGRVLAARSLGIDSVPVMVAAGWSDSQKRAYMLADNKLSLNAGWDTNLLKNEFEELNLADFELDLTGFSLDEIGSMLSPEVEQDANDLDDVPEISGPAVSKRGDVWALGRHRLLCGDALSDLVWFMDGIVADLFYFDPPYDLPDAWCLNFKAPKALVFTDHKHIREAMSVVLCYPVQYHFVWDTVISWYTTNRPLCRHRSAFYCAEQHGWNSDSATYQDDKSRTEKVIAGGGAFAGSYTYTPLSGGRVRLQSVYSQSKTLDEGGNGKPVKWIRALLNGADAREVCEPFAGTGATIIAAPDNCRVNSIEIDPHKVDAIVRRWELLTGEIATLENRNQSVKRSNGAAVS